MQINVISYQKTFNLGNYSSERIGLDANLEAGENPELALAQLKEKVEELHKKNNPQLYYDAPPIKTNEDEYRFGFTKKGNTITVNEPFTEESTPTLVKQTLAEQILTCNDIKVLHSYKLLIQKDADAKAAYEKMEKKLSKEPINIPTHENR